MGLAIIARNYAETLLELAERTGGEEAVDSYGRTLEEVAELLRREASVRRFLETPRVTTDERKRAVRAAFEDRVPGPFLRFLLVVIEKRRQRLLREIAAEYAELIDERRGRVRAHVTLAREGDEALRSEIVAGLQERLGKTVVATFAVDPAIVGGVLIRVGDQLYDGSLRRRIAGLRRAMMGTGAVRS